MKKPEIPGRNRNPEWWRYAWDVGSIFGVSVIVGKTVVNRLSRPSIKLG